MKGVSELRREPKFEGEPLNRTIPGMLHRTFGAGRLGLLTHRRSGLSCRYGYPYGKQYDCYGV